MSEENRPTMLTYIEETPAQLAANIENRQALVGGLVDAYVDGGYHNIWIVACGSSSNASQCAKPFMMKYLDVDVQVVPPNTFIAYKDRLAEDDFVFVVSQSGCSTNSIEALDKLRRGVYMEGDERRTYPAQVRVVRDESLFSDILVTIHEGRNRQVRRMFDSVGHKVLLLRRVRFGPLDLGDLRRGEWRELSAEEIAKLKAL